MFESLGKNSITMIRSSILSQLCQTFRALEGCRCYKEKLKKQYYRIILPNSVHSVLLNIKYLKR